MDLLIEATDIHKITFGLERKGISPVTQTIMVSPEHYLQALDQFLYSHKISIQSIKRLIIQPGPGSFTATRISVMIVNTIAFALQIPVLTQDGSSHPFVTPVYDRPASIT